MERATITRLRIGEWCVDPAAGQISREGETVRVEVRTMRLLLCLADHAGEVVSIDELLQYAWAGVVVSPDSVYQSVASLRRLLGDDARLPTYIATVPRLGYRMVAAVTPWTDARIEPPSQAISHSVRLRGTLWTAGSVVCLVTLLFFVFHGHHAAPSSIAPRPQRSVAVLPLLDLTEGMKEEEFADGMTEELIDKLSKIPGLRVTPPTSSFYYKNKQIPVADIAKALGVAYVLDGSVRKSGTRLRIAVRLIRADNGYVLWSETYDRPFRDILMVQDDIAGEVTKALTVSIGA